MEWKSETLDIIGLLTRRRATHGRTQTHDRKGGRQPTIVPLQRYCRAKHSTTTRIGWLLGRRPSLEAVGVMKAILRPFERSMLARLGIERCLRLRRREL